MTLEFQWRTSDVAAFAEEQRRFIPASPSRLYYLGILPTLFVALAVVTQSPRIATAFAVLFLSSSWLVSCWAERLYRRAAFSEDNLSIQTLPRRVTLSDDGVAISSDAGLSLYRWPYIREVVHGSCYVFFVLTPLEQIHIPIRAFHGAEHVQQFVSAAKSRLEPRAVA